MANVTIKIISDKTARDLKKYSGSKARMIKGAVQKSALNIANEAKRTAPVKTGRLRSSIKILRRGANGLGIEVGTNVEYAADVEFGNYLMDRAHGKHNPDNPVTSWEALRQRGGARQQMPFLRPAANKEGPKFLKEITKIMKK